ncbi:MAG: zinc ribbon domain-containing protein, partial [Ktedonobacteraceae bacterium]|nr:zinc ribbon domain-containing protein [Ktedonobacteraceae bacterium]
MRCPRCEAEIPDSATFCNRCGFSTRQGAVAAFSYLPAGTPAWPTTPLPRSQASAPMIQSTGAPAAEGKARRSTASILLTIVLLISAAV